MINPNFKNLAENLIIVIVVSLVSGYLGYQSARSANSAVVVQLSPLIKQAIDKETIKNEIKNEIKIDKIKKSDSIKITFSPHNDQKPTNIVISKTDSICLPIENLTRRQKKRLGLN